MLSVWCVRPRRFRWKLQRGAHVQMLPALEDVSGSFAVTGLRVRGIRVMCQHVRAEDVSVRCRWGQGGRQTLPVLQTLDLSGNSLTGFLPASWGQNSAMSSLKTLDLQKNNFSGSIPASWGVGAANQPRFSQLTALAVRPGRRRCLTHQEDPCASVGLVGYYMHHNHCLWDISA